MRPSLLLLGCTGCQVLFPLEGGDAPVDLTPTGVQAPALFEDHAADAGIEGPYLFEGSGFVFETTPSNPPALHPGVPIFVGGVSRGTPVSIAIPDGVGGGWEICGQAVAPGNVDLGSLILSPCLRGPTSLAFTVAVPVGPTFGSADASISFDVIVGDTTLPITILPLDEARQSTAVVPNEGLFSTIVVDAPFTPARGSKAVHLQATSTIEIASTIDAAGTAGQASEINACPTGCPGGIGGPGAGDGASSGCSGSSRCSAAGPLGGEGGDSCNTGGFCSTFRAAHGAGGGHAVAGAGGQAGSPAGSSCDGIPSAGGSADADTYLVELGGGGGGGAGANMASMGVMLDGGGGGGGGGVIAFETLGRLRVTTTGKLDVRGGASGSGRQIALSCTANPPNSSGAGGGGAGGSIRLLASSLEVDGFLATKFDVTGGDAPQTPLSGDGGRGRIRIDAPEVADFGNAPGTARGPDLESLPGTIVPDAELLVTGRLGSVNDGNLYWGVRPYDAPAYVLATEAAGAAEVVSIRVPLAQGLNELCVFAVPPASGQVVSFLAGTKRCRWLARVAPE